MWGVFHSVRRWLAGTLGRKEDVLIREPFRVLVATGINGGDSFACDKEWDLDMREFMIVQKSCKSKIGSIGTGSSCNEEGLRTDEETDDIMGGGKMGKSIRKRRGRHRVKSGLPDSRLK